MTTIPIKIQIVKSLSNLKPSRLIVVKADNEAEFSLYVTDKTGIPYPIKDESSVGGILNILNTDGFLDITGGTTKTINLDTDLVNLINSALQSGDNVSELVNDAGYITAADVPPTETFDTDVTFVLDSQDSFGKYRNGETAPWTGLTPKQAILDAAIDYINPVFNSFSVSGQATTIEVGTTLSGAKTFTWNISPNSGVVPTINIYNFSNSSTLLAGTANDGSQSQAITTVQLNSNGATQSWRGIGNNTTPVGTFDSSLFTVTARFYRFFGASAITPSNSTEVRALSSSAFQTSSASTFILNTGTVETIFIVALPPSVAISNVIDIDALNANITSEYALLGTINVQDAGGTNRVYNLYRMTLGAPYASNHQHQITTI